MNLLKVAAVVMAIPEHLVSLDGCSGPCYYMIHLALTSISTLNPPPYTHRPR